MNFFTFISKGMASAQQTLTRYRALTILLLGLFAMAGTGKFLQGNLVHRGVTGLTIAVAGSDDEDEPRACSGQHTIFEDIEVLDDVSRMYVREMNAIFNEREKILQDSSAWLCSQDADAFTRMPVLESLARRLPGWHVVPEPPDGEPVQRPVTFGAFSAIAAEFQREYECKLVELSDRAFALMAKNKDIAPGEFCCTEQGCASTSSGLECVGGTSDDPQCDQECPVYLTQMEIVTRLPSLQEKVAIERQRSRLALDRALQTMRSFDINFLVARELICYQRASLDLRNEFSLLADAISCMPKIWDAVTSIHDRKELP